jgi:hypothetical protein
MLWGSPAQNKADRVAGLNSGRHLCWAPTPARFPPIAVFWDVAILALPIAFWWNRVRGAIDWDPVEPRRNHAAMQQMICSGGGAMRRDGHDKVRFGTFCHQIAFADAQRAAFIPLDSGCISVVVR